MISESLPASELSAPLPRWAVGVSLALIAVITAVLVVALPPPAGGGASPAPARISLERH